MKIKKTTRFIIESTTIKFKARLNFELASLLAAFSHFCDFLKIVSVSHASEEKECRDGK